MRTDKEILKDFEETKLPKEGENIFSSQRSQQKLVLEVLLDIRELLGISLHEENRRELWQQHSKKEE